MGVSREFWKKCTKLEHVSSLNEQYVNAFLFIVWKYVDCSFRNTDWFFSHIDPPCNLQTRILAISNPKNSDFTAILPFWKFKSWNKLNLGIKFSGIYHWSKFGVISSNQSKVITIWILDCKIPGLYFTQI